MSIAGVGAPAVPDGEEQHREIARVVALDGGERLGRQVVEVAGVVHEQRGGRLAMRGRRGAARSAYAGDAITSAGSTMPSSRASSSEGDVPFRGTATPPASRVAR